MRRILLFTSLLIALTGCNSEPVSRQDTVRQVEPTPEQTAPDPWSEAISHSMQADMLTQIAQTSEEWAIIVGIWQEAIALMESVPPSNPNYAATKDKVSEYLANKTYAQSNIAAEDEVETNVKLLNAISTLDLETIDGLLSQGVDPNVSSEPYWLGHPSYAISYAASFGTDDIVKRLLESGARWEIIPTIVLSDALVSASCAGQSFTVQQLLEAGADPNYVNHYNKTPWDVANDEICRTMDKNGTTIQPGTSNHDRVLQLLQEFGARTPLSSVEGA